MGAEGSRCLRYFSSEWQMKQDREAIDEYWDDYDVRVSLAPSLSLVKQREEEAARQIQSAYRQQRFRNVVRNLAAMRLQAIMRGVLTRKAVLRFRERQARESENRAVLTDFKDKLIVGFQVQKIKRNGHKHMKTIRLDRTLKFLTWPSSGPTGDHKFKLGGLKVVRPGCTTPAFEAAGDTVDPDMCLSLLGDDGTMDLECSSTEQRDEMIVGFNDIIKSFQKTYMGEDGIIRRRRGSVFKAEEKKKKGRR